MTARFPGEGASIYRLPPQWCHRGIAGFCVVVNDICHRGIVVDSVCFSCFLILEITQYCRCHGGIHSADAHATVALWASILFSMSNATVAFQLKSYTFFSFGPGEMPDSICATVAFMGLSMPPWHYQLRQWLGWYRLDHSRRWLLKSIQAKCSSLSTTVMPPWHFGWSDGLGRSGDEQITKKTNFPLQ